MGIKMVVCDVDGTLIDHTEIITDELKAVVKECNEADIIFSLSTGRTVELAAPIVQQLEITAPCVVANGAAIYQKGQYLRYHGFCAEPISKILHKADEEGLTVTFSDQNGERAVRVTDYVREHQKFEGRFTTFIDLDKIDWKHDRFQKIMIMDENHTGIVERYQMEMMRYTDYYWVTTYSDQAVEIGPKECNKATGVAELAQLLGIELKQVMACGDFLNDKEMIQKAGIGIAVANAHDELKKAADYVTKGDCSSGVVEAIRRFCLIPGKE